ncbi:MAG: hypothetical protein ACUVRH_01470, partial [Candidatus Bipolaricaulia bacterium]
TIIVGPGTYRENLLIEKNLTIIGAGPEVTRIEGWYDDLPVIRILGPEEEFNRLDPYRKGKEERWTHFLTVNLHGLEVVFTVKPEFPPDCYSLVAPVGELDGEDCTAEVFVRGPARLILGGSRLLSGTVPPEEPPLGGLWAVLAEVTAYSTHIRGNWINLVFEESRVTLLNSLIEESFAPDPYQDESVGIALIDTYALLYRNRIVSNLHGIGIIPIESETEAILIENEIHNNHGAGICIGDGGKIRVQLLRNVISGSQAGLAVEADAVAGIIVCEGNKFEDNEQDLWSNDPKALAELAHRCGVELGGQ